MKGLNLQKDSVGWLGIILVTVILVSVQSQFSWLVAFPEKFFVPFDLLLNLIMDLMIKHLGWFFLGVSWLLEWPIKGVACCFNHYHGLLSASFFVWSVHCIRLAACHFCSSSMLLHGCIYT